MANVHRHPRKSPTVEQIEMGTRTHRIQMGAIGTKIITQTLPVRTGQAIIIVQMVVMLVSTAAVDVVIGTPLSIKTIMVRVLLATQKGGYIGK